MSPNKPSSGYGRPPESGQFRKGQSGNPRGRPPKAKTISPELTAARHPTRELLRQEAERTIAVTDARGRQTVSTRQAVIRATFFRAIQGSVVAQRTAFRLLTEEDERFHRERKGVFDFWREYQERRQAEIRKAVRAGRQPLDFLPHPDDIVLDWHTLEVRFLGAVDEESLALQQQALTLMDLALEMSVYTGEENRLPGPSGHLEGELGPYFLLHLAARMALPPRLRPPGTPDPKTDPIRAKIALGRPAWGRDLKVRCAAAGIPFVQWRQSLRMPTAPAAQLLKSMKLQARSP